MTLSQRMIALLLASGAVATAAQTPVQQPTFSARADLVRLDVSVTGANGVPVSALTADAFEVFDNGIAQPIVAFSADPQPGTLAVVLDLSDSTMDEAPRMESAVIALSARMGPGDRASVSTLWLMNPLRESAAELRLDLSNISLNPGSHVWPAVERTVRDLRPQPGRRAVLVATDGLDTWSVPGSNGDDLEQLRSNLYALTLPLREAMRRDVYAIQLHVVQVGRGRISREMREVSEGSGGRVIDGRGRADLSALFVNTLNDLRQQYALAFAPQTRDGAVHRIEVRMKDKTLRARHRTEYVAER